MMLAKLTNLRRSGLGNRWRMLSAGLKMPRKQQNTKIPHIDKNIRKKAQLLKSVCSNNNLGIE